MNKIELIIATETAMLKFAAKLADACTQPAIIYLQGNLGVGKTTLTRGFLQHLGYEGVVKSPTYTLVEPYHINDKTIYHFDLYRLQDPEELEFMGIRDYFNHKAIVIVEWPENADKLLPPPDLSCYIAAFGEKRRLCVSAKSELGEKFLATLK